MNTRNNHLESRIFKPYHEVHSDKYFPVDLRINPETLQKFEEYWKSIEDSIIKRINEILDHSLISWNTGRDQMTDLFDRTIKNLYREASDYGENINFSIQNIIDFLIMKIYQIDSDNKIFARSNDKRVRLYIEPYVYNIIDSFDRFECIVYNVSFDFIDMSNRSREFKDICILCDQMFVSTCVQLHNLHYPGYYTTGKAVSEVPVVETRMFKNQYFTKES